VSTRLQLCQRLRQEAGISGTGPATTIGQPGEMGRVVDWIDTAYEEIQDKHPDWEFLRNDFTFQTIASTSEYLPSAVALPEHASWKQDSFRAYLTSTGTNDEMWLNYYPWDTFRDAFMFGSNRSTPGKPTEFSVRPNKAVVLWPVPALIYTIGGEYYKRPQVMSANADEPLFPREFHMAIVWKALMYYGTYENAPEAFTTGQSNYDRILRKLEVDQLPSIAMTGTME
jgi:hypothetical protein